MKNILRTIWRFRYFIFSSIKTEFRSKFARSRLGGLWMILNPLTQVLIFAFVLSTVLTAKLPGIDNKYAYSIYLMSGILGWSLFADIVNRCLSLFIENGSILKKLAFPKIALPIIVVGSAVINNLMLCSAILLIFGVLGHFPGTILVWLPALMLVIIALAVGIGLGLGVLNVFIRDIGQIVPVVMQFLFWLTPIVYMIDIIPQEFRWWLNFNPLISIISAYQNVMLYKRLPDWASLGITFGMAIVLLIISFIIFRKASAEMVDQL